MKCRDCTSCEKGFFSSQPEEYVCIGVKEPFVIDNINTDCTEYSEEYWKNVILKNKKEIDLKDVLVLYDEESEQIFYEPNDFVDYYWDKYLFGKEYERLSFNDFFEEYVPHKLWNCYKEKLHIDAKSIVEEACWNLHEDAFDSIPDREIKKLQDYLDEWCREQRCAETYFPSDKEFVIVKKEWFG